MPPPGLHSLMLYDNFEWKTAQKSHENYQKIRNLTKIPAISLKAYEKEFYGVLKENYHQKLDFRNLAKIDNLKLCIISDVLAGKSLEKSRKDVSEMFGAWNINFSDFDFWFRRLFHDQRMSYTIPAPLYSDLAIIRNFILYDVLEGIPPDEVFQKLDKILKEELDYPKYEYLYYQIYNGNLEPDMPTSFETYFRDIPNEILEKIVSNLNFKQRMAIREVSISLRDVIESLKVYYSLIKVNIQETSISLKIDNFFLTYSENSIERVQTPGIAIEDENSQKMALRILELALKTAKCIDSWEIVIEANSKNKFQYFLDFMEKTKKKSELDVEKCAIHVMGEENVPKLLEFLKPGKLEILSISSVEGNGDFCSLSKMDQFKMAKEINFEGYGVLDSSLIDRFFHFDEFSIRLENVRTEDVIRAQTALEKLPNVKEWSFYSNVLVRFEIEQAIDPDTVVEHEEYAAGFSSTTKMPNSEYFINYDVCDGDSLTMKKYK